MRRTGGRAGRWPARRKQRRNPVAEVPMRLRIRASVAAAALLLACRGPAPSLGPPPPAAPAAQAVAAVATVASDPVGPKPYAARSSSPRRHGKHIVVGQLNVNRATEAELRLLPGIGKLRAKAIVARRQQRPFDSFDEVARIRGLKSIVRRLRAHLTLTGPTTLRPAPDAVARGPPDGDPPKGPA